METDLEEEADGLVHRWGHVGVGALQTGNTLLTLIVVVVAVTVDGSCTMAVGVGVGMTISVGSLVLAVSWRSLS